VGPRRAWGVVAVFDAPARLFDGWTGATVGRLPGSKAAHDFAPSPGADGRYIAAVTSRGVRLWDLADHNRRRDLAVADAFLTHIALDPRGGAVAAVSTGGVVYVWSAPGRPPHKLDLGTYARDVRFSPDGRYLAAAGDGSSARVWNLKTWRKYVLRGHTAAINSIAFSPGARLVVTAGDDGSVRVWTPRGKPRAVIRPLGHAAATDAEFSPDGSRIAIAGSRGEAGVYACGLCGDRRQLLRYARTHLPRSR
jgi:WD40 repeat protein